MIGILTDWAGRRVLRRKKMKERILLVILILMMLVPTVSHGFGLLRYTFDAIANQLGMDRGPIPKALPRNLQADFHPPGYPAPPPSHPDLNRIYIQAEGF
jgi:hypothetical protein